MQKYCIELAKERSKKEKFGCKCINAKGLLCKKISIVCNDILWQGFKAKTTTTTTTNIETLTITKWIVSVTPMLCNYYKLPYDDFKGCDLFISIHSHFFTSIHTRVCYVFKGFRFSRAMQVAGEFIVITMMTSMKRNRKKVRNVRVHFVSCRVPIFISHSIECILNYIFLVPLFKATANSSTCFCHQSH